VVGFDNVRFARYATPTLTTVAQDTSTAGRLLVSKLLDAGSGRIRSRSERLPTDLIVRESCGG
jgi:DNA-binding LacI/PurR family transcriptional regulator